MKKVFISAIAILVISAGAIAGYTLSKRKNNVETKPIKTLSTAKAIKNTSKKSYTTNAATKKEEMIKLYFPNGSKLKAEEQTGNNTPQNALKMLLEGPKDSGSENFIPKGASLLNFKLSGNKAIVNFSKQILSPPSVGAEDEELTIYSITNTLTEFASITNVIIQVEGKTEGELDGRFIEDFWGHVGLYDQPFKRNEALIKSP